MSAQPTTEPLVSVVVPFYNTRAYLAECIESVLAQTYGHWECVLLNNCSTDGSAELAAHYAARDPRVRVVHNETLLNQVRNYNRAMSLIAAESAYTKMVEADNALYPECLSQMVALAEAHPRVGIVSAYCITERSVRFLGLPRATTVLPGRDAARMHFLDDAYLFGAPTTLLFRSDLVRRRIPFFDESTWLVEDLSACYELLRECDFGFVHQILTFVRTENDGSIQSGRRGFEAMSLDRMAVLTKHGRDFLDEHEYAGALQDTTRRYYAALATGAIQRKGKAFWTYHKSGLATFGERLEYGRLARHVLIELTRLAANPGSSTAAALRRFTRRGTRAVRGSAPPGSTAQRAGT